MKKVIFLLVFIVVLLGAWYILVDTKMTANDERAFKGLGGGTPPGFYEPEEEPGDIIPDEPMPEEEEVF